MEGSCFEYIKAGLDAPSDSALLDVVFVHGLTGNHNDTWTHKSGSFWPRWLAEDFQTINVYSAGYDSSIFASLSKGDGASLVDRATMLLDRLASRKAPNTPILFVTHSLGGLVVKQMLRRSQDASSHRRSRLCENVKGVVFLATPHQGTHLAKSLNSVLQIITSNTVKELSHGLEPLIDLSNWFSSWATRRNLKVECYYEVEKYKGVLVVDKLTANPNVSGCDPIALQADHIEIAKLESRNSQLYQSISSVLSELLLEVSETNISGFDHAGRAQIESEYETYTLRAEGDRRNLAQKLFDANRSHEIERAERQKERFSMTLQRNIGQPSAVRRYTRLMSNIETRFNRFVVPAVAEDASASTIDGLIQDNVLDPSLKAHDADGVESTAAEVESAYYYLAGNCHIGWDND
tara:strand:+ start:219 stop:1439 length:1221 start_codon:yes stop_codon:yes gene_type:complete